MSTCLSKPRGQHELCPFLIDHDSAREALSACKPSPPDDVNCDRVPGAQRSPYGSAALSATRSLLPQYCIVLRLCFKRVSSNIKSGIIALKLYVGCIAFHVAIQHFQSYLSGNKEVSSSLCRPLAFAFHDSPHMANTTRLSTSNINSGIALTTAGDCHRAAGDLEASP